MVGMDQNCLLNTSHIKIFEISIDLMRYCLFLDKCMKLDLNQASPSWEEGPTMTKAISQFTMAAVESGKLILVGGMVSHSVLSRDIDMVDVSGPNDEAWETVAQIDHTTGVKKYLSTSSPLLCL